MAIYHLEAKVISRGTGRSACAASAYMSCSAIYNEYDGIQHDYTRKQGLVWEHVFLPDCAPAEWQDRAKLWNAVEEAEKTKDSRLAREFVVALPMELGKPDWINLLSKFICLQFVNEGMCADVAIHDTDGHNPHAHIMLTVRPLNENGTWQHKTEKEYLCVKGGEERGFTATEYKEAQQDGWEKQYQYKVGKKKEYMAPSLAEAQGLERASKYPKSMKYGRQNPISERWNSDEQLVAWRAAWADEVNLCLEQKGLDARIDHRSFADQGKDVQPTIHEGVAARAMERKGIISDRCELNRQIKRDNALLRQLKAEVQMMVKTVQDSLAAIAQAMEKLRANMIVFAYQVVHANSIITKTRADMKDIVSGFTQYSTVTGQIRQKLAERKKLLTEKKAISPLQFSENRRLNAKIAEATEDLEELKSRKEQIMSTFGKYDDKGMKDVKAWIDCREEQIQKAEVAEAKYSTELDKALDEYHELEARAEALDPAELETAHLSLRPEEEKRAVSKIEDAYGNNYDQATMREAKDRVSDLLDEDRVDSKPRSVRRDLQQAQEKVKQREQLRPRQTPQKKHLKEHNR